MKRILSLIFVFGCILNVYAIPVSRYIGSYKTIIANGSDTIVSIAPEVGFVTNNKKVRISVQYEIVSSNKSTAMKLTNVSGILHALSGNVSGANIAAMQASDISTMNMSVLVENISDIELSINERNAGSMYYMRPGEKLVINRENYSDFSFRFQYGASDIEYIDISASAECVRVDRVCRTEDYWIVKEKLDNSRYVDCVKAKEDFANYIQFPEKVFFVKINTSTFDYDAVRVDTIDEEIKRAKAKNKDMDND